MLGLNRSAIVLRPKPPFLEWLHAADPTSVTLTLADLVDVSMGYRCVPLLLNIYIGFVEARIDPVPLQERPVSQVSASKPSASGRHRARA